MLSLYLLHCRYDQILRMQFPWFPPCKKHTFLHTEMLAMVCEIFLMQTNKNENDFKVGCNTLSKKLRDINKLRNLYDGLIFYFSSNSIGSHFYLVLIAWVHSFADWWISLFAGQEPFRGLLTSGNLRIWSLNPRIFQLRPKFNSSRSSHSGAAVIQTFGMIFVSILRVHNYFPVSKKAVTGKLTTFVCLSLSKRFHFYLIIFFFRSR